MRKLLAGLWLLGFLFPAPGWAVYSDELGVPVEEVWQAALIALKPSGIRKADFDKKVIETKWVEDRVVRSRGLLKKVTGENILRRSKFKVTFKTVGIATEIRIEGVFRDKPHSTGPMVSWRKVKPELQDIKLEQALFFKILKALEELKRKS
jgi:hypothetical protein